MAIIETWFDQDIKKAVKVQYLDGNIFSQDNNGNLIGVNLFDEGEPATLGGSVSASVIRADGATVAVTGTLSENKCSVVLPQAAYAVPGVISVVIKITSGSDVTSVCAVVSNVYQSSTDSVVDPGTIIPSVEALIAEIEAAIASIPADYSNLWTSIAKTYSSSVPYAPGQIVTYDGGIYRCVTNISSGESWTSAHWAKIAVSDDLYAYKCLFSNQSSKELSDYHEAQYMTTGTWKNGGVIFSNISFKNGTTYVIEATYEDYSSNGYLYIIEGETQIRAVALASYKRFFTEEWTPTGNYTANVIVGFAASGKSGIVRIYEKPVDNATIAEQALKVPGILDDMAETIRLELTRSNISSIGVNSSSTIRLSTPDYIPIDKRSDYVIELPTGTATNIWLAVLIWETQRTERIELYPGAYKKIVFTPKDNWNYMKITIGKDDNSEITFTDVPYISVKGNAVEGSYLQIDTVNNGGLLTDEFFPKIVSGGFDEYGADTSYTTRLRSEFFEVTQGVQYDIMLPEWVTGESVHVSFFTDDDGETLRGGYFDYSSSISFVPTAWMKYMRIMVKRDDNGTITVKETPYVIVKKSQYKAKNNYLNTIISNNSNSANSTLVTQIDGTSNWGGSSYASGMCMVHGLLIQFGVAPDDHQTQAKASVYMQDNDFKFKRIHYLTHNFGHMNNVSYNEQTDCLIFGNGSGDYSLACEFYVYPNFFAEYSTGKMSYDISDAVKYQLSDAGIIGEANCNALWGFDNGGAHDLVYVITNDNQKIRLVQLGKGSNNLGTGIIRTAGANEFNGTYKIQKLYTQETLPLGPNEETQSAKYCVQDAAYRNGVIYAGIGHRHFEYWEMTLNDDGTINRHVVTEPMFLGDGTAATYGVAAIEVIDNYIIINTSGNKLISVYNV